MQTNNQLYEKSLAYVNEHKYQEKYLLDRQKLRKQGYVVSNIQIDNKLPNTPTKTGFVANEEIPISSLNIISYCLSLGVYPVVYQGENEGKLIRHVVPREGLENQISSYGSKETFYPHVDNPDLRLRTEPATDLDTPVPDTLTLLCLNNKKV